MFIKSFVEEWQLLLSKRMNRIVLFILPIIVVALMGFELDSEVITNVPLAVIDHDNSTFSRQLVDAFNDSEIFTIVGYPETEQAMEVMIQNSKARTGLVIPEDFYQDVADLNSPSVLMIYDGSHMSYTSAAKAKATEILLTFKAGAAIKQLTGRLGMSQEEALHIAQAFEYSNRTLYNPSKSFEDFLVPVLMAGYLQGAVILLASLSLNHTIYSEDPKKRFGYGAGKIFFYTIFGTLSFMVCINIQVWLFKTTFVGRMVDAIILTAVLCFAVSSFAVLISGLLRRRMIAMMGAAVVFIPNSVMAGTTWPLEAMPIGYRGFAKYMPFAHYANNLRDVYLKGIGLERLAGDIAFLIIFGVAFTLIMELVLLIASKESVDVIEEGMTGIKKEMSTSELVENL